MRSLLTAIPPSASAHVRREGRHQREDTIVAATSNGAKVLRVYDKTGSLEAGKSADLLVINGNPLENIRAIDVENMEVIMKEGEFIKG